MFRDGSPPPAPLQVAVHRQRGSQLEIVGDLRLEVIQEIKHLSGANGSQQQRDGVAIGNLGTEAPRRVEAPGVRLAVEEMVGEPDETVGQQQIQIGCRVAVGLGRPPEAGAQPQQISQAIILGVETVVMDGVNGFEKLVQGLGVDPQGLIAVLAVELRQDRDR